NAYKRSIEKSLTSDDFKRESNQMRINKSDHRQSSRKKIILFESLFAVIGFLGLRVMHNRVLNLHPAYNQGVAFVRNSPEIKNIFGNCVGMFSSCPLIFKWSTVNFKVFVLGTKHNGYVII